MWRRGQGESDNTSRKGIFVRHPRSMEESQNEYSFRRSRTLSGSLSSSVTASKTRQPDLKSDRVKLHELHSSHRFLRAGLILLLGLVLVSGFLLAHSMLFADIRLAYQRAIPASEQESLQQMLTDYVNRNPSQAFTVSFNEQQAAQFLQQTHPEVAFIEADVSWFGIGADALRIGFRKPIVVWQIAGQRYYVSKDGVAFKRYWGPQPRLKVEDQSGYQPELAKEDSVASQRFIGYLGQLLGKLQDSKRVGIVERVVIPPVPQQLHLYIGDRNYPIKTNTMRNPTAQAHDIAYALKYFDEQQITPEYVDVRVEGKAYYK